MPTRILPTVLIVDDQSSVRNALRYYFETSGTAECIEAVNGVDGIEKARQSKPDLVLLDFSMPEMNGLETAKAIKQTNPAIPLIMLTAHVFAAGDLPMRDCGIEAIFSKYNVAPMIECVRTLLSHGPVPKTQIAKDR